MESPEQLSGIPGLSFFAEQGEIHDQASKLVPQQPRNALGWRQRSASSERDNLMQVPEGRMITLGIEDAHGVVELDQPLREKARGIGLPDSAISYDQHVGLGRRHPDSATAVRLPQRNLPATRRGQWRTSEDPITKEIRDGFPGVGRENSIGFSLQGIDGIADCNGKLAVAK
jgi:hypothetical protein